MIASRYRALHGPAAVVSFDSFRGLPEAWDPGFPGFKPYAVGSFQRASGAPPFEDPHIRWVVGPFNATLPRFLANFTLAGDTVSLLHVDADLYSSAHTVFE